MKKNKYIRIYNQIKKLTKPVNNPFSRMSTITAVLHFKMKDFFWTGFYLLTNDKKLQVAPYQGPLACLDLPKDNGVCWEAINKQKTVIVPDVNKFPGHIACSPLSKSEIVVPLKNESNKIKGVLDIDSKKLDSFDETDAQYLEKIVQLIYA